MNRDDLRDAYSELSLDERKKLAEHMGHSMSQQYQYIMRPSSDSIGKERKAKFLSFLPEEKWLQLAEEARNKIAGDPIELKINWPELVKLPDIVLINEQKYIPAT